MVTKVRGKSTQNRLDIVMNDFRLWSLNMCKIIDNNGESVPFRLNEEQESFINDKEKYNIILKGRQIGFTTMSLAYMLYLATTKSDTSYMIMTQHNKVTQSLLRKIKMMYKSLPHNTYPDLFPKMELSNRDEIYFSNNSRILVATAGGEDSISGNTFQLIHFSEMAKYPNDAQEELIATAIPALAKNPYSSIIIESTAMGENFYADMFRKAYRGKETVWKAHFYSWLSKAYIQQFKHSFDEAEEWFRLHNQGRRMTSSDLEHDEMELRDKYKATYRQLMYRRYYIATNSLEKWNREFPITPEVAFATSNKTIFDINKITDRIDNAIPPVETSEIYDELPDMLKSYINKNLFIYHPPKQSQKYVAGCDVATGNKGDYSTLSIFDFDGQQVAAFRSNDIPVYKFTEIVNALGRYYNKSLICIERNHVGIVVLEKIRKQHSYINLVKQKVFDSSGKKKSQLGYMVTQVTKPILLAQLVESFDLGLIQIENIDTLEEMKIYQEDSKTGKTGNKAGRTNHDDMISSLMMLCEAMKNKNRWYV